MSRLTAARTGAGYEFESRVRKDFLSHIREQEEYASNQILKCIQEEKNAEEKEARLSRAYVESEGKDMCLYSLEGLVKRKSPHDVLIPSVSSVPKYCAWVPVSSNFAFNDVEDIKMRLPTMREEAVGYKAGPCTSVRPDMKELKTGWENYENQSLKFEPHLPTRKEVESRRLSTKDVLDLSELREQEARNAILVVENRKKIETELVPFLKKALKIPRNDTCFLSKAKAQDEIRKENRERRCRMQEFLLCQRYGTLPMTERNVTVDHCDLMQDVANHFCLICKVFVCGKHDDIRFKVLPWEPIKDKSVTERMRKVRSAAVDPCGSRCYSLASVVTGTHSIDLLPSEREPWSEEEKELLKISIPVFRCDPCRLASCIGTRTCREVFAILEEPYWKEYAEDVIKESEERREIEHPDLDKLWNDIGEIDQYEYFSVFTPCNHEGTCTERNCPCVIRNAYCQPLCSCNSRRYNEGQSRSGIAIVEKKSAACTNRHDGCQCESGGCNEDSCPCWKADLACESWCKCSTSASKCNSFITKQCECDVVSEACSTIPCHNIPFIVQERIVRKRTIVGKSPIHGIGLYAAEDIRQGEFIGMYNGHITDFYTSELLGLENNVKDHTFVFDLDRRSVADAAIFGSRIRFINHANAEDLASGLNIFGKTQVHRGMTVVAYIAKRDIPCGEELLIDYKFNDRNPNWLRKVEDSTEVIEKEDSQDN